jgi:hypothetical protein
MLTAGYKTGLLKALAGVDGGPVFAKQDVVEIVIWTAVTV